MKPRLSLMKPSALICAVQSAASSTGQPFKNNGLSCLSSFWESTQTLQNAEHMIFIIFSIKKKKEKKGLDSERLLICIERCVILPEVASIIKR